MILYQQPVPGSSVYGIFQARILEYSSSHSLGDLPDPGIEPGSPALQANSLPSKRPEKPQINKTEMEKKTKHEVDFGSTAWQTSPGFPKCSQ